MDIMGELKQSYPTNQKSISLGWRVQLAAFLHSSEFTVPSQQNYNAKVHLSLSDVNLDSRHSPSMVCINIKQSKTDPFRQGVYIYLGRIHQHVCLVDAIIPHLVARGSHPGTVFILPNGKMLTRNAFGSAFDNILANLICRYPATPPIASGYVGVQHPQNNWVCQICI